MRSNIQRAVDALEVDAAIQMSFSERVIELPEMLHCNYHGDFDPRAYYEDREIVEMIDEFGRIDCPLCLRDMVDE